MFKLWQRALIFIGVVGCLCHFTATSVFAQSFKETHRETIDESAFIDKYATSDKETLKAYINKVSDPNTYICGMEICDKEKETCLKCTYTPPTNQGIFKTTTTTINKGKCVSNEEAKGDIRNLFQDCGYYEYVYIGSPGGAVQVFHHGKVSIENNGFTNMGEKEVEEGFLLWKTGHKENVEWSKPFTGADGKSYQLRALAKEFTIAYGSKEKAGSAFKGCEVFPVKAYKMQGCFYCKIARIVFDTADEITGTAFSNFAASFKAVLGVVLAIWLVLMAANYAFSMTKQDAPKFLNSVLTTSFKVALAFYLLTYSTDVFRFFIRPILEAGLAMGEKIQTFPTSIETEGDLGESASEYFGASLRSKIEVYLTYIQSQLAYMQAVGSTIFCVGSHRLTFWTLLKKTIDGDLWDTVIDAFRVMFLGGFFTVFGFLLTIAFGYYFVDAIVQLIIIGAMVPFMIATWPLPFGQTKYATKGFEMLINTFLIFFMTGFVVCVNLELINKSLATSQEIQEASETSEKATAQGFQTIIDALYDQNWEKVNEATTLGTSGFLLLVFSALFGFQFVGKATEIAGKLSAGVFQGRGGLAGRVGTMAASAAKGVAGKLVSPFAEGIADQYHAAGGALGMAGGAVSRISKVPGGLGNLANKASQKLAAKGWNKTAKVFGGAGKALNVAGKGMDKTLGAVGRFTRKGSKKIHGVYRH